MAFSWFSARYYLQSYTQAPSAAKQVEARDIPDNGRNGEKLMVIQSVARARRPLTCAVTENCRNVEKVRAV
jgi:hypothetical protein